MRHRRWGDGDETMNTTINDSKPRIHLSGACNFSFVGNEQTGNLGNMHAAQKVFLNGEMVPNNLEGVCKAIQAAKDAVIYTDEKGITVKMVGTETPGWAAYLASATPAEYDALIAVGARPYPGISKYGVAAAERPR